jgi:putative peptidoglycan lipid II flippase
MRKERQEDLGMIVRGRENTILSNIFRSTGVVIGITVFIKIFGFVEKLILAYYFGTGYVLDSYLVAFSVPLMLFVMVREIIEPSFLPTFMGVLHDEGEKQGWRLASNAALSLAGVILAPQLVGVLAPGFDGQKRELTTRLVRILMPSSLFLGMSALTYITLNAYKRFAVPALGDVFFKIMPIAVFVLLYRFFGITGLAAGVIAGAAARLSVHCAGLREKIRMFRFRMETTYPPVRRMSRLMGPLILGIIFSQLSLLIDNAFASTLAPGSISALSFAKKLAEMPIIIIPYALGIVLFPYFSELAIAKNHGRLIGMLLHAIKMLIVVFVPVAVIFIVLRVPLVRLLFERGEFNSYSTQVTSSALMYYSFGILFFAIEAVLVQFYFSTSDTRTPVIVGIICVCLNILFTYALIAHLKHNGIALALTVSKALKVMILYLLLMRRFRMGVYREPLILLCKALFAGIISGACMYGALALIGPRLRPCFMHDAVMVLSCTAIGAIVYVASGLMVRTKEYLIYWEYMRDRMPFSKGRHRAGAE